MGWREEEGIIISPHQPRYVENFGIQWSEFSDTQIDSKNGTKTSENRLFESSGWRPAQLRGKLVLEVGAGAGRFTEVLLNCGAEVVCVEPSDAVEVNCRANDSSNALFLRSSFEELTEWKGMFDFVLAYGVAQHVPKPLSFYQVVSRTASTGGRISIDHYPKRIIPSGFYHPKHLWRPITTRMRPEQLLAVVRWYVPRYMPFDSKIIQIFGRRIGMAVKGLIPVPCWNYLGHPDFPQDFESLQEWAILDTFDALGAAFDKPASRKDIERIAARLDISYWDVKRGGNGWILNATAN